MKEISTPVTKGLIIINVVVHLLGYIIAPISLGNLSTSLLFGMYKGAMFLQPYRLITSGFVHASILHLLSNMYMLYILGNLLEEKIGSVKFSVIYMFSLLGSSVIVNFLSGASQLHVGASGAIWGLMTASLLYMVRSKNKAGTVALAQCLIINFIFSFSAGISWQGHFGGGLSGLIIGSVCCNSNKDDSQ